MATERTETPKESQPALERTPEIRETGSGNMEIRKDPEHIKTVANPEQILDPKCAKAASQPDDILAYRRTVGDPDTPLE